MKKLLLAMLLASAPAYADEPPPPPHGVEAGEGEAHAAHGEEHKAPVHHDHTKHFNFTNFSYSGKDFYGGAFGDGKMIDPHTGQPILDHHGNPAEEEAMSPPFVFMLLNFALLLLILAKFGGPQARKLAQERHDQIKVALDEAAKLRDQAAKKLAEYETRIKDVDAEVQKIVDGIRTDAEADKKRILAAAEAQAAQMKRDAELRIAAEIELARAQLTKEVTAAAANATEKLLREKTTSDDQTKLVATFISNVQAGKEAR
jgi:F-type H+-transporting ATPase subunit b